MEEKSILVHFSPEERRFYDLFIEMCAEKGVAPADEIKDNIKKSLAWGKLAVQKRKKP